LSTFLSQAVFESKEVETMRKNDKLSNGEESGVESRNRFRESWTAIWLDLYQQILAYARTLTNGDLHYAENLVQEVYLRVFKYAPNPSGKNPLLYMKGMIRNAWIDSRQRPSVSLDELFEKDPQNPVLCIDDDILKVLETREYFEIIGELVSSPELRLTLELFAEGHDWETIATTLGESVRTTRFRWYTFCEKVRKNFEGLGITLH
jgi:DNA-directed RNA polymerase specialized sigma24 family protein